MIKAVIFDMNGVIIDDEHVHELAFKKTVSRFGIKLTHNDYIKCCAGKTDEKGYENLSKEFSIKLPIKELLKEKANIYYKLFPKHKKSFPGLLDLIKSLSSKYILALNSGSLRSEVELVIKEFSLEKYFKVVVSANDVTKSKPDPEPYLLTCNLLSLNPKECVVIEDSHSGVIAAKAAGCFCIGVTTTYTENDLKGADMVVGSFSKIEALISRLN